MKKSISFLLALTALVLCACGGSVPQQTDEPAEVSASPAASALPGVYPLDFFKDTEALWQQEQDGTRTDYDEFLFDVPASELSSWSLYGDFYTAGLNTRGNWSVTFQLEP